MRHLRANRNEKRPGAGRHANQSEQLPTDTSADAESPDQGLNRPRGTRFLGQVHSSIHLWRLIVALPKSGQPEWHSHVHNSTDSPRKSERPPPSQCEQASWRESSQGGAMSSHGEGTIRAFPSAAELLT